MKILLLEDEFDFAQSVSEYLTALGYEVDIASDGIVACDLIANNFYHLFMLDIKVPNVNGFEVIKYIKSLNIQTPIMITTSLTDIDDMAIGYELGCNEYLKKPFELAELKFRVTELMRKYYNVDDKNTIVLHQGFSYNVIKKILFKGASVVDLSAKETELVGYLSEHANRYVSITELRDVVWDGKEIEEADIRMHVLKIRNKTTKDFISSKRRVGYKIDAKNI
ncbi:response regulator transcription factor [Campylobacter majalis]|uniref:response regulator transcription factor n=1 Tax=Campylobacter majalis TaxID=2790656 RepID=UPI003D695194